MLDEQEAEEPGKDEGDTKYVRYVEEVSCCGFS